MPTQLPKREVPKPERPDVSSGIAILLGVTVLVVGMLIRLPVPNEVAPDLVIEGSIAGAKVAMHAL